MGYTDVIYHIVEGRMACDIAVKLMLKTWVKAADITDIDRYFYINNLDTDLKAWLPETEISAKGYMQMRIVRINF